MSRLILAAIILALAFVTVPSVASAAPPDQHHGHAIAVGHGWHHPFGFRGAGPVVVVAPPFLPPPVVVPAVAPVAVPYPVAVPVAEPIAVPVSVPIAVPAPALPAAVPNCGCAP